MTEPQPHPTQGRTRRGWATAGAALSARLSVTFTRHPVSTLTPAPAVPALNRSAKSMHGFDTDR
jgi:hypothetical protein